MTGLLRLSGLLPHQRLQSDRSANERFGALGLSVLMGALGIADMVVG